VGRNSELMPNISYEGEKVYCRTHTALYYSQTLSAIIHRHSKFPIV
jgi:hypothetical protein